MSQLSYTINCKLTFQNFKYSLEGIFPNGGSCNPDRAKALIHIDRVYLKNPDPQLGRGEKRSLKGLAYRRQTQSRQCVESQSNPHDNLGRLSSFAPYSDHLVKYDFKPLERLERGINYTQVGKHQDWITKSINPF